MGDLPVILLEVNPSNGSVLKTYIYANSQIIAQHDGDYLASRYFYLHDRLKEKILVDVCALLSSAWRTESNIQGMAIPFSLIR